MKLQLSLVVLLSLLPGRAVVAQTATGQIDLTVVDSSGALVPGATIRLVGSLGVTRRMTNNGRDDSVVYIEVVAHNGQQPTSGNRTK